MGGGSPLAEASSGRAGEVVSRCGGFKTSNLYKCSNVLSPHGVAARQGMSDPNGFWRCTQQVWPST